MAAAATGTPSWALASRAYAGCWRSGTAARCASAAPTPSPSPRPAIDGWSTRSPSWSPAPSQTKKTGPKKPSVTANSCLATRRGSPTAATASPEAKPASISDTCTATARAAIANSAVRLTRSSTAN